MLDLFFDLKASKTGKRQISERQADVAVQIYPSKYTGHSAIRSFRIILKNVDQKTLDNENRETTN